VITGQARFIHRAEPCFCTSLQPGARGRLSLPIPPAADGLFFDHRGFRHFRGDDGFHDNHGFHGDGGENNFGRGVGHGDGMGHGGGAGRGR